MNIKDFFQPKNSLKKGISVSTGFGILSKTSAFFTNILIAYYFGSQTGSDVYFLIFTGLAAVTTFITNFNSATVVPEYMRIKITNKEKASGFVNSIFVFYLVTGILICLSIFFAPVKIFSLLSNFPGDELERFRILLLFAAPLFLLNILNAFWGDLLTANKFYSAPYILSLITNISAVMAILFFARKFGITSVLIGLNTAAVSNFLLICFLLVKDLKHRFVINLPETKFIKNALIAFWGNIVVSFASFFPFILLSGLSAGVLTSVNYGYKTAEIPVQFIAAQIAIVLGIRFNELINEGKFEETGRLFSKGSNFLALILAAVTGYVFLLSEEIIQILFVRGAFTTVEAEISSQFLKIFVVTVFFQAVHLLILRLFMGSFLVKQLYIYQIILNLVLIVFSYFGIKSFGATGFAYSLLAIYSLNFMAGYFICKRYFGFINYRMLIKKYLKYGVIFGVLTIALSFLKPHLDFDPFIVAGIFLVIYTAIFVLLLIVQEQKQKLD
ncbi:MAG: hypothetical protein IAE91_12650 [Ignavibacteriaceae bacterium]|nr:hypothetical protein [Ignavibacteriaceae bacterium]